MQNDEGVSSASHGNKELRERQLSSLVGLGFSPGNRREVLGPERRHEHQLELKALAPVEGADFDRLNWLSFVSVKVHALDSASRQPAQGCLRQPICCH